MKRKELISLLVVLAISAYAGPTDVQAMDFSCKTVEGSLLFTNDPSSIPPGCRTLSPSEQENRGSLSIVQFPQDLSAPTSVREILAEIENERWKQNRLLEVLKQEAQYLTAQYQEAVRRMLRTHDSYLDAKLRDEIREIKDRRDDLLAKNEAERFSFRDRDMIPQILEEIPP
jgi:hypothetical protein